jgi:uncharacterized protein YggE
MRKLVVGATLAAALLPAPTLAQVAPAALAPGEILLEVNAVGTATARADVAVLHAMFVSEGETPTTAEAAHERMVAQVRQLASELGGSSAEVRLHRLPSGPNLPDGEGIDELVRLRNNFAQATGQPTRHMVNAMVEIRLRNPMRAREMISALRALGIGNINGPTYALSDDQAARRAARAAAIVNARGDAEAQAAAMNMRVVRLVRITDRVTPDTLQILMRGGPAMLRPDTSASNVDVVVTVGADFTLAPR